MSRRREFLWIVGAWVILMAGLLLLTPILPR